MLIIVLTAGRHAIAQYNYSKEEISEIADFENCFPQLSNPQPHKVKHTLQGGETVTTIERSDFKNHRFVMADPDNNKLNIAIVDKTGLRYSDRDIESMLDDQFATGPGLHLNAHGVTDTAGRPIGVEMDGKVLDAKQTVELIMQTLNDFNIVLDAMKYPFPIMLHTCNSGKGDDNSFAAEVSRLMSEKIANSTVVAADDVVYAAVAPGYYEEGVGADQNHIDSQRPWKIFSNGETWIGNKSYKKTMRMAAALKK